MQAYGRKFHLKFVDGTEKTYDAKELEFFTDEEFEKGGIVNPEQEIQQIEKAIVDTYGADKEDGIISSDIEQVLSNEKYKTLTLNGLFIQTNQGNQLEEIITALEKRGWKIYRRYAKGGALSIGDKFGDWSVTQYKPIIFEQIGGTRDGLVKLVNQDTLDEILIQYDGALRNAKWFARNKGVRIEGKNPKEVIEKLKLQSFAKGGQTDSMETVNEIGKLTGLRPVAVAEWGDKHKIYFSSFAEVMDAINDIAEENGYKVVDIFPDLSYGGVSYGQTKRAKVELEFDGTEKKGKSKKREKNTLNVQIYRMDSGNYELNTYFAYAEGGMMAKGGMTALQKLKAKKSKYADGGIIDGLTADEAIFLYIKRGLKSPFREKYLRPSGMWNTDKGKEVEKSLIKKGYLNSAGSINEDGKNKAKEIDLKVDYAISRGFLSAMDRDKKYKEVLEKFNEFKD